MRAFDEVERSLTKGGVLNDFLEAVWPAPKPEQVVRQLLSSRERLAEAADGILDADEQRLLHRRAKRLERARSSAPRRGARAPPR